MGLVPATPPAHMARGVELSWWGGSWGGIRSLPRGVAAEASGEECVPMRSPPHPRLVKPRICEPSTVELERASEVHMRHLCYFVPFHPDSFWMLSSLNCPNALLQFGKRANHLSSVLGSVSIHSSAHQSRMWNMGCNKPYEEKAGRYRSISDEVWGQRHTRLLSMWS